MATASIATAAATATAAAGSARHNLRLHRQQALTLQFLARELAGAAHRFRFLPCFFLGRFFVMTAQRHLAENALALHLFLQRLEGLVDIVVADKNLHLNEVLWLNRFRSEARKPPVAGLCESGACSR